MSLQSFKTMIFLQATDNRKGIVSLQNRAPVPDKVPLLYPNPVMDISSLENCNLT
jgi:hypothetical protein